MMRKIIRLAAIFLLLGSFAEAENKPRKIDFIKQIQPILEYNCVGCHREGFAKESGGAYRMDVKELAFKGRREGTGVKPGDHESSTVWEFLQLSLFFSGAQGSLRLAASSSFRQNCSTDHFSLNALSIKDCAVSGTEPSVGESVSRFVGKE